ncbi:MAG: LPP20 family lipoprotein [Campylobacterota bacterium]|nr:LPP20 family lipoprotein [Campylobacterota bacterium]
MRYIILTIILLTSLFSNPLWLKQSSNQQYIGGVGIVNDISQKRIALMQARAELLENIKVHISSTLNINRTLYSNGDYKSDISRSLTQKAEGYLKNSFKKDSFIDKDGRYYVWVVIEK